MKILYGVVGEGMGHAMRSRVVLEHLTGQGHEIVIMASGRANSFLAKHFQGVNKIHGFHMISEENRIRRGKTLWSNVLGGATSTGTGTASDLAHSAICEYKSSGSLVGYVFCVDFNSDLTVVENQYVSQNLLDELEVAAGDCIAVLNSDPGVGFTPSALSITADFNAYP